MRIIPVIDLKGGLVVRAVGGRRNEYQPIVSSLVASAEPGDVARALVDGFQPAEIYVADLDAIIRNQPHDAAWQTIASRGCSLLLDAGIRTADQAGRYQARLARQVGLESRLVIGLETFESLDQLATLSGTYVFSLDLKHGQPLARDPKWQAATPLAIAEHVAASGITSLIVLDLADVGSGRGPSTLPLVSTLHKNLPQLELIAGGGVNSAADLRALRDAGAAAALVASALHDGRVTAADFPG